MTTTPRDVAIEAQARAIGAVRQKRVDGELATHGGDRKSNRHHGGLILKDFGINDKELARWCRIELIPPRVREEYWDVTKPTEKAVTVAGTDDQCNIMLH